MRPLLLVLIAVLCAAAEPAVVVPKDVAAVLEAAQAGNDPRAALAVLDASPTIDHALLRLLRGQSWWRVAHSVAGDERTAAISRAEQAFVAALALDGQLRAAHLALAEIAAEGGAWTAAVGHCAQAWRDDADLPLTGFYIRCAIEAGDTRLAQTLVSQGIVRFPLDHGLRRFELVLLARADRAEDVRTVVLALLDSDPSDGELWRHLAWAAQATGRNTESLQALEMACLASPDEDSLRRSLVSAQVAAGLPQAALANATRLIGQPPRPEALADAGLMELVARAADDAGERPRARAWLAAVPEPQRTRGQRLLAARLAVLDGAAADALAALGDLIRLGETDPRILTWAGAVAEQAGDSAAAEGFYAQALAQEVGPDSGAALRLAALYLDQERLAEARTTLASHLSRHPDDTEAKQVAERIAQDP